MGVLDLIFPVTCLGCDKSGLYICSDCLLKVTKARPFCIECRKPSTKGETHLGCRKEYTLDFAVSAWDYGGVIRKAILKLKYSFVYMIAEELADKFIEKINKERIFLPKDAVLIPIPLYQKRKNWRGFNQSEEIGKMIANKLKWEYQQDILVRTRKTIPQTELKGQERLQNISGAFSPNSDNLKPDKTYILLDDVLTTGSTLKEACKKLKQNGAKTVWGITIAC